MPTYQESGPCISHGRKTAAGCTRESETILSRTAKRRSVSVRTSDLAIAEAGAAEMEGVVAPG